MSPTPSTTRKPEPPNRPVPLESFSFATRNTPEFSCEEYAGVLADHESLLRTCADRLLRELRSHDAHCWWDRNLRSHAAICFISGMQDRAAIISDAQEGDPPDVVVTSREELADDWDLPPAIVRRLKEGPEEAYGTFYVVVETPQGASLRGVSVDAEDDRDPNTRLRLYLPDEERVVSPLALLERRLGPFVFTLSETPWSWLRVDITRAPRKVAPPEEQVDWLFAVHTPRVLRWLWDTFLSASRGTKLMMIALGGTDATDLRDAIGCILLKSDGTVLASVLNRPLLEGLLADFRRIPVELAKPAPSGWLPVLVRLRNWGGLRWLRVAATARGEAPQAITEMRKVPLRAVETAGQLQS